MAVPDWPTTYGYNMFFFPVSQWTGGIFYEHTHRLVASVVGMLTAILAAWIWVREAKGWPRNTALAGIVCTLGLMGVRTQGMFVALASVASLILIYSFVRAMKDPRPLRWWAAVAFTAVLVQGVLGGLRVTQYKDELGIFHGTLAQLFFVLICAIALFTSKWWQKRSADAFIRADEGVRAPKLQWMFLVTTVLIFLQLVLGATMRHQHAGLAIPDFPLAYGKLWPAVDAQSVEAYNARRIEVIAAHPITATHIVLQMAHRLMAVAIVICVALVAWKARRWSSSFSLSGGGTSLKAELQRLQLLSLIWLGMILVQVGLGAWTIWSNKAADIATAHVLVGALSLVTGALACIICFRHLTVPLGVVQAAQASEGSRASTLGANPATALNP